MMLLVVTAPALTAAQTGPVDISGQAPTSQPVPTPVAEFICKAGTPCAVTCATNGATRAYPLIHGVTLYTYPGADHLWMSVDGGDHQILLGDSTTCDFSSLSRVNAPGPTQPVYCILPVSQQQNCPPGTIR